MKRPIFRATDDREVALCPREREDTEFVRDNVNHHEVRRLMRNTDPKNAHVIDDQFEDFADRDDSHNFTVYADVDGTGDPDERVGTIFVGHVDHVNGVAWMGAWIAPEYQGNGYAPRATTLVVDFAFAELNLAKVKAGVFEPNRPSQRVMEKLGFECEGVHRNEVFIDGEHRDSYVYGIVREEWERGDWNGADYR
jgi:RimJ/RimL family protein N-acetyltransferase